MVEPMSYPAVPEYVISQMRRLTMPEMTYFYVTNRPTPFAKLDQDLDPLIESLHAAIAQAHLAEVGPDLLRYYPAPEGHSGKSELFLMELGVSVKPDTLPAGEAKVKVLPPFPCAALLLWGGMTHMAEAYGTLKRAMQEAGLESVGESRERYYHIEGGDSPHNVIGIYLQAR